MADASGSSTMLIFELTALENIDVVWQNMQFAMFRMPNPSCSWAVIASISPNGSRGSS